MSIFVTFPKSEKNPDLKNFFITYFWTPISCFKSVFRTQNFFRRPKPWEWRSMFLI